MKKFIVLIKNDNRFGVLEKENTKQSLNELLDEVRFMFGSYNEILSFRFIDDNGFIIAVSDFKKYLESK